LAMIDAEHTPRHAVAQREREFAREGASGTMGTWFHAV
jgi:hypothetical protein